MRKIGCTSPFVRNLNNICTRNDRNQSLQAMKLYNALIHKRFNIKNCSYPCSFLQIKFRESSVTPGCSQGWFGCTISAEFHFDKFIKVSTSYYAYTELELLAEFGGYVGMFLGVSVFHLSDAFNKILQLILRH